MRSTNHGEGMASVLVVNAGLPLAGSSTRRVVSALLERLRGKFPNASVVERDLVEEPLPHFNPADPQAIPASDLVCAEFLAADFIVVGTPMWNFSMPSALKAWIDHLVRAGVIFHYTAEGPRGLAPPGKTLYVVEASGGSYAKSPASELNHVSPYLEQIFRFLGVTKVETVRIDGTALHKENAEAKALEWVCQLVPSPSERESW